MMVQTIKNMISKNGNLAWRTITEFDFESKLNRAQSRITHNTKAFDIIEKSSIFRNKYLKYFALTYFIICSVLTSSTAQIQIQENKADQLIYIEADPFAYLNKGYSIHLGYENWGWRFDLTKEKVDFPESFEEGFYSTKAFDLVSNISGIKIDYLGNRTNWTKGAFIGLDVNYQTLKFQHRTSLEQKNLSAFNVGLRSGFKINIFKGFYVTPWVAVWKNTKATQSFAVDEDIISTNPWDWIATLHFGYALKI